MRIASILLAVSCFCALPASADPLRVVFVSGSFLYDSDAVLAEYASWFDAHYDVTVTIVSAKDWDDLPGLEALEDCDVALFYTRRLRIDGEPLQRIRDYVRAGKPIVAMRTASHGFEHWPEFDREVLGGDYQRHFPEGPATAVRHAAPHAILEGVPGFSTMSSLYRNPEINPDCTVLLRGTMVPATSSVRLTGDLGPESTWTQPVAWVRDRNPGRVFYTSLGAAGDFAQEPFRRLIANALYWAASLDAPEPSSTVAVGTSSSESR